MSDEQKTTVVEYVFKRLAATYGAAWDRSLGQAPIADVVTVWEYQLQQFTQSTAAKKMIIWALQNLPDRCPNVIEFKTLCGRAPMVQAAALPAPKADPARVAEELAKMAHLKAMATPPIESKAWAKALKACYDAGERLNPNQVRCFRNALHLNIPAQ